MKTLKYHIFSIKHSIVCDECGIKNEKIFKDKESTEILKIVGLLNNMKELYI